MSEMRSIDKVVKAQGFKMGNLWVKQSLPSAGINQVDPFLLIHHAGPFDIKAGANHTKLGVGPHPHRGFEPVSFIFKGSLQHRDSLGNNDILDDGDVQWMTSGKGIIHSERPPKKVTEKGGEQEFIQLWVNIPGDVKMSPPKYQNIRKKDSPVIKADSGTGSISVIAGEIEKKKGPTETFTPILALKGEFNSGAKKRIRIPEEYNALLYVVRGEMKINGVQNAPKEHMILFGKKGDFVEVEASSDSWFLLLAGEPIKEAVATYGPFVMNNNTQIMEAIRDFQNGEMGELIENFD